jgi:transcriptional antiterminator RfaH
MDWKIELSSSSDPWYVVHCKAKMESYAALRLNDLGIVTFLPELKTAQPGKLQSLPLFPGYVFIQANLQAVSLSQISCCPGVLRLLDFGDGPVPVDNAIIQSILHKINNPPRYNDLKPDDLLRIKYGPLRDLEAIFIGPTTPSKRVRVLLHFLGGLKEAMLDRDALEKIPDPPRSKQEKFVKRERYTRGKGRKIHAG